jgi:hypothetical protein
MYGIFRIGSDGRVADWGWASYMEDRGIYLCYYINK